jgi:hypothetical protein
MRQSAASSENKPQSQTFSWQLPASVRRERCCTTPGAPAAVHPAGLCARHTSRYCSSQSCEVNVYRLLIDRKCINPQWVIFIVWRSLRSDRYQKTSQHKLPELHDSRLGSLFSSSTHRSTSRGSSLGRCSFRAFSKSPTMRWRLESALRERAVLRRCRRKNCRNPNVDDSIQSFVCYHLPCNPQVITHTLRLASELDNLLIDALCGCLNESGVSEIDTPIYSKQ